MSREISLTKEEMDSLKADLKSGKLTGDDKVIAEVIAAQASNNLADAEKGGPAWLFTWTYRF